LTIPQRVVDVDLISYDPTTHTYSYHDNLPPTEVIPIEHPPAWNWNIPTPDIQQMQLANVRDLSLETVEAKRKKVIDFLQQRATALWKSLDTGTMQTYQVKEMLELVQLVQSPYVIDPIPERVVRTAEEILNDCKQIEGFSDRILPTLFQLESSLMYTHNNSAREIIASGFYGSSWIDVARIPIEHGTSGFTPSH
jgi:hypothetical protein